MAQQKPVKADLESRNARTGLIVLGVVLFMVGMSFAAVPLYTLFCRVTGLGGKGEAATQVAVPAGEVIDRTVTVQFNADSARNLPWDFEPDQRAIEVKIGQQGLAAYTARNNARAPVTGSAVFNVTPLKAGKYFHKIQCFCFNEQLLKPGEEVSMPVLFYLDPAMAEDPNMDDVSTVTLSYTFYKTDTAELEQAMEDFYNQ